MYLEIYGMTTLLPCYRCNDTATRSMVAELTQVYALPRSQIESAVGYGHRDRHSHDGRLGMCRHVIRSFERMYEIGFAVTYQTVEHRTEVTADIWIGIFIYRQGRRGVFYEQMQQAAMRQRRQCRHNLIGYQMEAPASGAQCKFSLTYHMSQRYEINKHRPCTSSVT